jgi:hypothetical protein
MRVQIRSIFNHSSVFGQLRSLIGMQGLAQHGTAGGSYASPSPSPESASSAEGSCDVSIKTGAAGDDVMPVSWADELDEATAFPVALDAGGSKGKREPQRRPIIEVEPGSLYHMMQQKAGTSLFIRPVAWTDVHSKCLGAVWTNREPILQPVPDTCLSRPEKQSKMATSLVRDLNYIFARGTPLPFYSVFPIRDVLATLYLDTPLGHDATATPELHMWFGGLAYRDAVRVQCLWTWPFPDPDGFEADAGPGTSTESPSSFMTASTQPAQSFNTTASKIPSIDSKCGKAMLAYVGRKQLAAIRDSLYKFAASSRRPNNEPVSRLQEKRCQMLMPGNLDHDPHFVAIMVAMAQHHIYPQYPVSKFTRFGISKTPLGWEPNFRDVTVRILTNDNDAGDFLVYTATVTADHLQRLHYPAQCVVNPSSDGRLVLPRLDIEVTRVPTWPVLGLKERLGLALGEDVAGPVDVNNIETWQVKSPPPSPSESDKKRSREDHLPMFDGSFDDEPSEHRPGKKPRLGENGGPPEIAI